MASTDFTSARKLAALERKRDRARRRDREMAAADPEYRKRRYRRWLELHPNGNKEAYKRALERDPDFNKNKRERARQRLLLAGKPAPQRRVISANPRESARERERRKYQKNKAGVIARVIRQQRERYAKDSTYAMCQRLRARIKAAMRSCGQSKSSRSMAYIGCTRNELVAHIEKQFAPGMSWANRREWHIDHIIPVSAFDLNTEEGQHAAFHYTNLRPIWAHENLRKSSKPPAGQRMFKFGYVILADERRAGARRGAGRKGNASHQHAGPAQLS